VLYLLLLEIRSLKKKETGIDIPNLQINDFINASLLVIPEPLIQKDGLLTEPLCYPLFNLVTQL